MIDDHQQRPGIDYIKVYAAVIKAMFIQVLLALVVIHNLEIKQLNIMNVFLNADLQETIYMKMPHEFAKKNVVCLLQKTLYDLHQSP